MYCPYNETAIILYLHLHACTFVALKADTVFTELFRASEEFSSVSMKLGSHMPLIKRNYFGPIRDRFSKMAEKYGIVTVAMMCEKPHIETIQDWQELEWMDNILCIDHPDFLERQTNDYISHMEAGR